MAWMVVAWLLLVPSADAQRVEERTYHAFFSGLSAGAGEKFVIEAFTGQDPSILLSLDIGLQQAKVRTAVVLDATTIRADLQAHGITLELLSVLSGEGTGLRSAMDQGFPVFRDTGAPLTDQADYEARKQAWIAAHPGSHQQLFRQATTP